MRSFLLRFRSRWLDAVGHTGGALFVLVLFGARAAGSISFPITLDPTIPNAWVVAAYIHDEVEDLSAENTYLDGSPEVGVGYTNVVTGGGGAYSGLDQGALGLSSTGFGDGGGTGSHAYMIVNVPFSGSGTNTVRFDVSGSEEVAASNVYPGQNTFMADMSYSVQDASTHALLDSGSDGAHECDPSGPACNQPLLSFPIHLSNSFSVDRPVLVQLSFTLFSQSNSPLTFVDAASSIALDLAPGVTMDDSSGFLSTPGDPHLIPEPSTTWLSVAASAAMAALARVRFPRRARPPSIPPSERISAIFDGSP
jgi:hypothetical protein